MVPSFEQLALTHGLVINSKELGDQNRTVLTDAEGKLKTRKVDATLLGYTNYCHENSMHKGNQASKYKHAKDDQAKLSRFRQNYYAQESNLSTKPPAFTTQLYLESSIVHLRAHALYLHDTDYYETELFDVIVDPSDTETIHVMHQTMDKLWTLIATYAPSDHNIGKPPTVVDVPAEDGDQKSGKSVPAKHTSTSENPQKVQGLDVARTPAKKHLHDCELVSNNGSTMVFLSEHTTIKLYQDRKEALVELDALLTLKDVTGVVNLRGIHSVSFEQCAPALKLERLANLPDGAALSHLQLRCVTRSLIRTVIACHERGIAHCDIKPDNVMLRADNAVVLIDFGLASTTSEVVDSYRWWSSCGTPGFIWWNSPVEQAWQLDQVALGGLLGSLLDFEGFGDPKYDSIGKLDYSMQELEEKGVDSFVQGGIDVIRALMQRSHSLQAVLEFPWFQIERAHGKENRADEGNMYATQEDNPKYLLTTHVRETRSPFRDVSSQ
jgi:hypothetical protein